MTSDLSTGSREVVVAGVRQVSDCVREFSFRSASGEPFDAWEPGAHVAVTLANGITRQYSLCGDPSDRTQLTIAVLREPSSRGGSAFLHDTVSVGDRLDLGAPRNNFPLLPATQYVFVAGGIGVSPLLPMVEQVALRSTVPWRFVYGGKARTSMAYIDRLLALGDGIVLRPQDEYGLLDFAGDVTSDLTPGAAVYACGPEPMLAALERHCESAGVPLHLERFTATSAALAGSAPNRAFVCELATSGRRVEVGPDESIVQAMERSGIFTKADCREGTCGSCETTVLRGDVDHRDVLLSEAERRESASMMICVSRATSPQLVLDL